MVAPSAAITGPASVANNGISRYDAWRYRQSTALIHKHSVDSIRANGYTNGSNCGEVWRNYSNSYTSIQGARGAAFARFWS